MLQMCITDDELLTENAAFPSGVSCIISSMWTSWTIVAKDHGSILLLVLLDL